MLGSPPLFSAQLAAERASRFATEATHARWRRALRQPHPAPPCAGLVAQLPDVVVDLRASHTTDAEPAASR